MAREQKLSLLVQDFILAARVVGVGDWDEPKRHLLPNVLGPESVAATLGMVDMPWLWLVPGVAISFAVICINFIGDGLRDAFDVRGRQVLE